MKKIKFGPEMRTTLGGLVDGQDLLDLYQKFLETAIQDVGKIPEAKHLIPYIQKLLEKDNFKQGYSRTIDLVQDDTFLIHGDLWNNNIMFSKNSVDSCKVYDWQFFCSGSPSFDVMLLLVTGLKPDNLDAWMPDLCNTYFDRLEESFKEFNLGDSIPFTKDQFIEDCFKKGLVVSFNMLMTSYDPLWRKPELIDRFVWTLGNVVKHCPLMFPDY